MPNWEGGSGTGYEGGGGVSGYDDGNDGGSWDYSDAYRAIDIANALGNVTSGPSSGPPGVPGGAGDITTVGQALGGSNLYGGWEQASALTPQTPPTEKSFLDKAASWFTPGRAFMIGTMLTGQPMVGGLAALTSYILGNVGEAPSDMTWESSGWNDYERGGIGDGGRFDVEGGREDYSSGYASVTGGAAGRAVRETEDDYPGDQPFGISPTMPERERYQYRDAPQDDRLAEKLVFDEREFTKSLF